MIQVFKFLFGFVLGLFFLVSGTLVLLYCIISPMVEPMKVLPLVLKIVFSLLFMILGSMMIDDYIRRSNTSS